ncbi:MAG: LPS export ABC transporter permease LptG [Alphaproteobacteria bacterium]|jgi:lipopolysaccharide export system permease protein|nr:LPS export ABC transporter permease LptG [Alphaproteobacteria bacterium]
MTQSFSVLFRYFFKKFSVSILTVFGIASALVFILDLIELTRIANDASAGALTLAAELALMRTPSVAEQVLPFAALFGGLFAFLALARSRELVVVRAAGMSVWQMITPPILAALFVGALGTLVLNPVSALLKSQADTIMARANTDDQPTKPKNIWLRQKNVDGEAIIRADVVDLESGDFRGMTVFEFDRSGQFIHRVEAPNGHLDDGLWLLRQARVLSPGTAPERHDTYELATYLTRDQVRQSLSEPDTISVYDLPSWARATAVAGLDATRYLQQFQLLIAKPAVLAAMLMIAATVSLRFARTGIRPLSILGGIGGGFAFYVFAKVAGDFGSNGLLNPIVASFLPPLSTCLLCTLVLLYLEDG